MKRHLAQLIAVFGLLSLPLTLAQANDTTPNYTELANQLLHNTNLSHKAIESAFAGYEWALKTHKVHNKDLLTIVDFTLPSNKHRLYVINMHTGTIMMGLYVSHGKNSGPSSKWTKSFSNKNNSLQSSLGVYLTEKTYHGKHGFSLRIKGLEKSNNNAYARSVVVHAAEYATPNFITKFGRAGTSWGCFAVAPTENEQLIDYIKNGSVIYAYGKSEEYMASTKIYEAHSHHSA